MMEVLEYGRERLAAGPAIEESDEIVVVEGRADVLTLLKHGFKNVIAMNGTSAPQTIKELSRKKTVTVFVDGDRGGDLIVRELLSTSEIDFVCKAPDGKEVEELTKKEIHKCLRARITAEQAKMDLGIDDNGQLKDQDETLKPQPFRQQKPVQSSVLRKVERDMIPANGSRTSTQFVSKSSAPPILAAQQNKSFPLAKDAGSKDASSKDARDKKIGLSMEEKKIFKETMEDLFGTRGACIFDSKLNVLGKVPLSELATTIKSLNGGVYALALDGAVDVDLVRLAEKINVNHLIGSSSKMKEPSRVNIWTEDKL